MVLGFCSMCFVGGTGYGTPSSRGMEKLVPGARFMDRFLPMPDGVKGTHVWGTDNVQNRYVDNGIELPDVFFWGWKHFTAP